MDALRRSASAAERSAARMLVRVVGGKEREVNEYEGMSSAQMVKEAKKLRVPGGKTPKIFSNRLEGGFATDHIGSVFRGGGMRRRHGQQHVHKSMHAMTAQVAFGDI
eukprot:TRINITY_DN3889_c0_g1_i2.p3 TRINITY_DN3889_c0_g1~~TRINITY_DN3889_c0_g1_i2.p3  ORF type:complete len:107 (+),score=33.60 TRINITY_DN3889_c0_g1_i2:44-364(+)